MVGIRQHPNCVVGMIAGAKCLFHGSAILPGSHLQVELAEEGENRCVDRAQRGGWVVIDKKLKPWRARRRDLPLDLSLDIRVDIGDGAPLTIGHRSETRFYF